MLRTEYIIFLIKDLQDASSCTFFFYKKRTEENYQTNVYLHGLYYVLFKHILINLTSFMGIEGAFQQTNEIITKVRYHLFLFPYVYS
jgi:hypothetical protein